MKQTHTFSQSMKIARKAINDLDKLVLNHNVTLLKSQEQSLYRLQEQARDVYMYFCDRIDGRI